MRYLTPFLIACVDGKSEFSDCPPNSTGEESCTCEEGYYGAPTWNDELALWEGECISSLDMAIQTGDPSYLDGSQEILSTVQQELLTIGEQHTLLLQDIYANDGVYYEPTEWSNHIQSWSIEDNFILVQGSQDGNSLAAAGQQGDSRYAAFGFNVLVSLDDGGQSAFIAPFNRLLSWMLTDSVSAGIPQDTTVALSSVGWYQDQSKNYLEQLFASVEDCDSVDEYNTCFSESDLIVVGANGTEADRIVEALGNAIDMGKPVLFLHTETWDESELGNRILDELHMSYGSYGGNYWSADKAEWSDINDMIENGGLVSSLQTLFQHLEAGDYAFDWSQCTEFVGQIFCDDVPGMRSEFLAGAQTIRLAFSEMDERAYDLFSSNGSRIWKMSALLADVYRRDITYPMSKTDSDIMPFMRSYYADHAVLYHRTFNPIQSDLGTFSEQLTSDLISISAETINIQGSKYGGFTALGVYALPEEVFTVERVDSGTVDAHLLINTQRTGSTREFNDDSYDRPKFLQSPPIPLPLGQPVALSTPYGGTLQVWFPASDSDPEVELEITNVGEHPVLNYGEETTSYLDDLSTTLFPFTEIRTPYIQIHSKSDMMLQSIEDYNGDMQAFFDDVDEYLIQDTYNLAGFVGEGLQHNRAVQEFCSFSGWDCTNEDIHSQPALQHINVDTYAHCGGGCSGNPYDQAWALGPLGWGETHEIGHNLQRGRIGIYDGRSSEVSNQIFPLHKHLLYYTNTGESLSPERVSYRSTYDTLMASLSESDPVDFVYNAIWAAEGIYDNNNERMAFYIQLVHCNDDLEYLDSGWDIYTLMYLQERLFSQALTDWTVLNVNLGFDTYTEAPHDISGNDFMLISSSFITERDQRPFFDLWGITYTAQAAAQVESFQYPAAERIFVPHDNPNRPPENTPIFIREDSVWPE